MGLMTNTELAVALLTFGIIFMLAEIAIYTFGVLAISGTIIYLVGIILLLTTNQTFFLEHWVFLFLLLVIALAFVGIGMRLAIKSFRRPVVTGKEGLMHEIGIVVGDFNKAGKGHVRIHGEIWAAHSHDELKNGEEVLVTKVKNLILEVKKRGA